MADSPVVLIVEHQPDLRLVLEHLVQSVGGIGVMSATTGRQAVDLAVEHRPDVIMMAVVMPEIDGYTACQMIRDAWGDHQGQIWFIPAATCPPTWPAPNRSAPSE